MGPLAPDPIALLSREFIGTTSAAVPEKKDSSACKTSSIVRFFSSNPLRALDAFFPQPSNAKK